MARLAFEGRNRWHLFTEGTTDVATAGQLVHHLHRRLRCGARPGCDQPAGRRRRGPARVAGHHEDVQGAVPGLGRRHGRPDGRRRRLRGARFREPRRLDPRPQHVRSGARAVARRQLEGMVGREPALPRAGVRAHAPRSRAHLDGGRNDLPLRDRRHPRRAGVARRTRRGARTSASAAAPRPSASTCLQD